MFGSYSCMEFFCKLSSKILPNIKTKRPGLRMISKDAALKVLLGLLHWYVFIHLHKKALVVIRKLCPYREREPLHTETVGTSSGDQCGCYPRRSVKVRMTVHQA